MALVEDCHKLLILLPSTFSHEDSNVPAHLASVVPASCVLIKYYQGSEPHLSAAQQCVLSEAGGGGAGQWIWHHHCLSRIILMEIFFLQQLTPLHIYCNINASYLNIFPTLLLICSNAHGKQGIGICGGDRRLNRTAFCFCLFPL